LSLCCLGLELNYRQKRFLIWCQKLEASVAFIASSVDTTMLFQVCKTTTFCLWIEDVFATEKTLRISSVYFRHFLVFGYQCNSSPGLTRQFSCSKVSIARIHSHGSISGEINVYARSKVLMKLLKTQSL
jgi:hypothetical protein